MVATLDFTGEEKISTYQSSEWGERGFCQQCGTHLFYRLKQNNQYYIPAGIFNNQENFIFDHQIFIDRTLVSRNNGGNLHMLAVSLQGQRADWQA